MLGQRFDFCTIKRILKSKNIEIIRQKYTLNGETAYKIKGSPNHNPYATWTLPEIKKAFLTHEFDDQIDW